MVKSFHVIFIMGVILLLAFGFFLGFVFGMNRMQDIQKQVDCEMGHYESFEKIPADCIKYLLKK